MPNSRSYRRTLLATTLPATLLLVAACGKKEQLVQGDCQSLNGANVCTWGRTLGDSLVSFGATIPIAAIDNAPDSTPMVWPPKVDLSLSLPPAVKAGSGFDNMTVFWEAEGHPPAPYLTPHFDFHFNTIPASQIGAIDCADSTRPAQLPAGYEAPDVAIPGMGTLIGLCVPGMGMHALPSAELKQSGPFGKDLIVGYYQGKTIFVEPMISRATLKARQTFALDVPAVPNGAPGVRYPSHFTATYDSTANAYRFEFTGLGAPQAP